MNNTIDGNFIFFLVELSVWAATRLLKESTLHYNPQDNR